MKYITFAIPSYNSEEYLHNAVESILVAGTDIEILIINDGSSDNTSEIAHRYETQYPHIIQAIDQENGGHGSAVNTGLRHATGKYFKVVDSDDWVNKEALKEVIQTIKDLEESNTNLDMLITNFVYEKQGQKKKKVMSYDNALPEGSVFQWQDMGKFQLDQYIIMHSVIYRTDMLKLCQLELPKHTFYVDNIYMYYPLPFVRDIYYLNVDFYRYFIGRDDQSVNEKNMIQRIDQQIFVTKSMIDMYQMHQITPKRLREYMINYLAIMMSVSSIICIRSKDKVNLDKKKELWRYLRHADWASYSKIRFGILGQTMHLPGKSGRKISSLAYTISRRLIGFN